MGIVRHGPCHITVLLTSALAVCSLHVFFEKRRVISAFFKRLDEAVCQGGRGKDGFKHLFFGDGDWPASRKGNRSSPGPKTMMKWAQERHKEWDVKRGQWTTRVVPVWEWGTSQCCPNCGARQNGGEARRERRRKGKPSPDARPSEWRKWRVWRKRPTGYENQYHAVSGLKICSSNSCGPRAIHSRDGAAAGRCIGRAGRALVEGRPRPVQLLPKPHQCSDGPRFKLE